MVSLYGRVVVSMPSLLGGGGCRNIPTRDTREMALALALRPGELRSLVVLGSQCVAAKWIRVMFQSVATHASSRQSGTVCMAAKWLSQSVCGQSVCGDPCEQLAVHLRAIVVCPRCET